MIGRRAFLSLLYLTGLASGSVSVRTESSESGKNTYNAVERGEGDLAAGFNSITGNETPPYQITIPPGDHDVTAPLDLTVVNTNPFVTIDATSVSLNPTVDCNDKPVIDAAGARSFVWNGPTTITDGGNAPSYGILESRSVENPGNAGSRTWRNITVDGAFTHFPWATFGIETTRYEQCVAVGKDGSALAEDDRAAWAYGANAWTDLESEYADARDGVSTNNVFEQAFARVYSDTIPDAFAVSGHIANTRWTGGGYGGYRSFLHCRTNDHSVIGPIKFDARMEGPQDYSAYFSGGGSVNRLVVVDGQWSNEKYEVYGPDVGWAFAEIRGSPRTSKNGVKVRMIQDVIGRWRGFRPIETTDDRFERGVVQGITSDDVVGSVQRALFLDPDAGDQRPMIQAQRYGDSAELTEIGVESDSNES